jgi:chaperonin cofactor prefoldin
MSRRRHRSLDDLDDLLPNELIETTSGSTVVELKAIVDQLEEQMDEMIENYEKRIKDLSERLESIENDFKQVLEALDGTSSAPASPAPTQAPSPQDTKGPGPSLPSSGPKLG